MSQVAIREEEESTSCEISEVEHDSKHQHFMEEFRNHTPFLFFLFLFFVSLLIDYFTDNQANQGNCIKRKNDVEIVEKLVCTEIERIYLCWS